MCEFMYDYMYMHACVQAYVCPVYISSVYLCVSPECLVNSCVCAHGFSVCELWLHVCSSIFNMCRPCVSPCVMPCVYVCMCVAVSSCKHVYMCIYVSPCVLCVYVCVCEPMRALYTCGAQLCLVSSCVPVCTCVTVSEPVRSQYVHVCLCIHVRLDVLCKSTCVL